MDRSTEVSGFQVTRRSGWTYYTEFFVVKGSVISFANLSTLGILYTSGEKKYQRNKM